MINNETLFCVLLYVVINYQIMLSSWMLSSYHAYIITGYAINVTRD